jgi:hypothetical protein
MTKISDLHRRWSKDAAYQEACDGLGEEFDLARALIRARTAAGLSQAQLVRPSADALGRFAEATHTRLRIILEPQP